jgi:plasmid stabilization system protein ParE
MAEDFDLDGIQKLADGIHTSFKPFRQSAIGKIGSDIEILRVSHGAKDWPKSF